ncbi:hypothetical protein [Haliangium sp.]|uniref:hypothetical protein n=1 Tax=Haliangium sp. TaxID=2663208 RepID=UPI003D0DB1C4
MSLRDDVEAGLREIDAPGSKAPLVLNPRGACVVTVPVPPQVAQLTDGAMLVQVQMGRTGRYFSLRSALAKLKETPDVALLEHLLVQQYYPDPIGGLGFAISAEDDALVATYHWIIDGIDPNSFAKLFSSFSTAMFDVLAEIAKMARRDSSLEPVHPKAGL